MRLLLGYIIFILVLCTLTERATEADRLGAFVLITGAYIAIIFNMIKG